MLRPWATDTGDAAALGVGLGRPGDRRHVRSCPPTATSVDAAAAWIAADEARRAAAGRSLDLVIALAATAGTVLGEVGLRNVDRVRRPGGGQLVDRPAEHRGRGLATAGVRLLVDWALSPSGGRARAGLGPHRRRRTSRPSRSRTAAGLSALGTVAGAEVWARTAVRPDAS